MYQLLLKVWLGVSLWCPQQNKIRFQVACDIVNQTIVMKIIFDV